MNASDDENKRRTKILMLLDENKRSTIHEIIAMGGLIPRNEPKPRAQGKVVFFDEDFHYGDDEAKAPENAEGKPPQDEFEKMEANLIKRIRMQSMGTSFRPREWEVRTKPYMGSVLENLLVEQDLTALRKAFLDIPDQSMDKKELSQVLRKTAQIYYASSDMTALFSKMDINKRGRVTWDDFLTYILMEMQASVYTEESSDLVLPLSGNPRIVKAHHRFPVVRVAFFPIMQKDRSVSFLVGRYATISRDGKLNYWTLDFELHGTADAFTGTRRITESWVTDMVFLPDVSVVCTSSTGQELCFFDTAAMKFEQRLTITRLPFPVVALGYQFFTDISNNSVLIAADMRGNVFLFHLDNRDKGPFQYTHSSSFKSMRLEQVVKGKLKRVSVVSYMKLHSELVKQVGFFVPTRCLVTCAACSEDSLILKPLQEEEEPNIYSVPRGVTCFTIVEEKHLVAAGCMNGAILIFDVYVRKKASYHLLRHNTPVLQVVAQEECRRLYSVARDRAIKCWDVLKQTCIQTYLGVPADIGVSMPLSFSYNPVTRNLVIAGVSVALLVLGAAVDEQRSDGFTHTMGVVRALYNPLYKCVVTVGLDSMIMVWDVWEGKRTILIRNAHSRSYYGVPTSVEITAATFDPAYHYLITGATDGSLKVWNFNMGYCVRSMNIEPFCEVTGIVWMPTRILVVGWDRHVTEFSDEDPFAEPKVWETRHTSDVLCMALRAGESVATSSDNGELVLWRADTGQAYRRYNVESPRDRIVLMYTEDARKKPRSSILMAGTVEAVPKEQVVSKSKYSTRRKSDEKGFGNLGTSKETGVTSDFVINKEASGPRRASLGRMSISVRAKDPIGLAGPSADALLGALRSLGAPGRGQTFEERKARRVSVVKLPVSVGVKTQVYVSAMLFLKTRPMSPDWGTLLVSTSKGLGQVWSHHPAGKYFGSYLNIHMAGDYVTAMTCDEEDRYLITGTSLGYIKIWYLSNFGIPSSEKVQVCMAALRLEFPFMWKDRVEGRAKRSIRNQPLPLLLNSYRGHLLAILDIVYIQDQKVVLTASADTSVRLWSLSGLYLGTLGGLHEWTAFNPTPCAPNPEDLRIPADIKLVMSSTTMKVLRDGNVPRTHFKLVDDSELLQSLPAALLDKATYGRRPGSPMLGKYLQMQEDEPVEEPPAIDVSFREIPVYSHLRVSELQEIKMPQKPRLLIKAESKRIKRQAERKAMMLASRYSSRYSSRLSRISFRLSSRMSSRMSQMLDNRRSTINAFLESHAEFSGVPSSAVPDPNRLRDLTGIRISDMEDEYCT